MESQDLAGVLLDRIRSLGLISHSTYSKAVDLVYSRADFPDFFQRPARLAKGADRHECAQDTQ